MPYIHCFVNRYKNARDFAQETISDIYYDSCNNPDNADWLLKRDFGDCRSNRCTSLVYPAHRIVDDCGYLRISYAYDNIRAETVTPPWKEELDSRNVHLMLALFANHLINRYPDSHEGIVMEI